MTRLPALVVALGLALSPISALAAPPGDTFSQVALEPIRHREASLTLTAPDGTETRFDPAGLEALGAWSLTTRTPWRDAPATFEGPLLSDVLAAAGLADVAAIDVVAENDYAVTISREVWESAPILLATRVDGRAHTRRARGPIQFVMDMDAYEASGLAAERDWVWMAARIAPAE